ncbi:hypothetical protein AAFF_G00297160 [Aldrovandia affinis]|uniref:Uncharacterized protein n=1 Tax=Aldrovandia affinis TaxID=143900 RepID=A0AAD7WRX6_9TELE|nr:hypothetical protein AAFF_G00297160 [Aldrovandia affinis]
MKAGRASVSCSSTPAFCSSGIACSPCQWASAELVSVSYFRRLLHASAPCFVSLLHPCLVEDFPCRQVALQAVDCSGVWHIDSCVWCSSEQRNRKAICAFITVLKCWWDVQMPD